jgi:hypothetical protein
MGSGLRRDDKACGRAVLQIQHDGQIARKVVKPQDQKYFALPEF